MAEVVEVENVETQDCEFISEKMSEAQRKDLCKELEKHPCLWETCGPEYKNKPRRSRALDELSQKFNISPRCLKKQLHSLRTALTREVKKETTEGQQSRWKFYTALSYMKDDVVRSLKAKEETEWTEEETEQLIEFYKQNDQLWNHHLTSYRDRNLRDLNFKKLCEILPNRSQDDVKKQWSSLKTIFYRELKREEDTKVSGAGTDTAYFSQWRYFKAMMFIKGSDDVDPAVTTLATADEKENERPAKKTKADKSREMDEIKLNFFKEAVKCLQSPAAASQENNDSISWFVKSLESQLRRFSGRQLAIAKKRINDVIFDLEMECYVPQGTLAPTSTCSSLSTGLNAFNPQAPVTSLNSDNLNWSFQ